MKHYVAKAEFEKQIRRVWKHFPELSRMQALDMLRDDQLPGEPCRGLVVVIPLSDKESKARGQAFFRKHGLSMWRGLYMETPTGIKDGKVAFSWGPQLRYAGLGGERHRDGVTFDGEAVGQRARSRGDGLEIAMVYAMTHGLYEAPGVPRRATMGSQVRTCRSCGGWFSGRNGAKTCSAKCRKRLERALKAKELQNVTLLAKE